MSSSLESDKKVKKKNLGDGFCIHFSQTLPEIDHWLFCRKYDAFRISVPDWFVQKFEQSSWKRFTVASVPNWPYLRNKPAITQKK